MGSEVASDVTETELHQVIAKELGEKKVRFTDRRLLIIYLVLTVAIIVFLAMFAEAERRSQAQNEEFEVAITQVCDDLQDSHENINGLLDQLATSAANRPDRTPEQKAEAARIYQGLKLARLTCP